MQADRFEHKFNLFMAFGLSLSLTTPIIHGLGYYAPGLIAASFCTGLAVVTYALIHLYPILAAAIPALLLALAASFYWIAPGLLEGIYHLLYRHLVSGDLFWPLAIIAFSSLAFYVLLFRLKNPLPPLLVAGVVSFPPLWYLYVDSAYLAAVTYAACWLLLLSRRRGDRLWARLPQKQSEQGREAVDYLRRNWLRYTVSTLGLALLLAFILPKDFGPVSWPSMQNWADQTVPFLAELRGGEERSVRGDGETFNFYASGFQETSRLGGPLRQDRTVLMEVRGRGGVYLKGSVKDLYAGRSWTNTAPAADLLFFPPPPEALHDYLVLVDLRIRHRRLKTKSVFNILYPLEVTGLPRPLQIDENSGITFPRSIRLDQEYRVKGLLLAYRVDFSALEKDGETLDLSSFLSLPDDLPPRVRELALEVTADQDGHYQKLKTLESYLRRQYSYGTDTPAPPENRDFVDYFLFDLQEGYCTSFASALAVMARAAGVPTRYVEGFKVPDKPSESGVYKVAGIHAHAWVEGYVPGVGWLLFEATPAFRTADSLPLPLETVSGDTPPAGGDEFPPPSPPGSGSLLDIFTDFTIPLFPIGEGLTAFPFMKLLFKGFLTAVLFALTCLCLGMWRRVAVVKKMIGELNSHPPRLQVPGYYNLTLSLLERIDLGKYPGETPREYSNRIIHHIYTWNLDFKELSEGINLALYSEKTEIPAALAEQSRQFFRYIFERYLQVVGKWTAFLEIFLQRKFF